MLQCRDACLAHAECKSYQFYVENGAPSCFLKDGTTTEAASNQNCGGLAA